MTRATAQNDVDSALLFVKNDLTPARDVDIGLDRLPHVGHEDVRPPCARDLSRVEHHVGKVVVENTRLDLAFSSASDCSERNLPKGLVRIGKCNNQDVARGEARGDG